MAEKGQDKIPVNAEPRFLVLLATYNGTRHLKEQMNSLAGQSVSHVDVLASDDGSTDGTQDMLAGQASRWGKGRFEVAPGPCKGFAENFRSLILYADANADYYAFCDQDDIWEPDKLEHARSRLVEVPALTPALYCGATRTITEDGRPIGMSPIMRKPPSFRNALVQSIAGGNTMVMNQTAFRLLRQACEGIGFVSHDWWAYLVVSGAGGVVIYDRDPQISYRQHAANLVGANTGVNARLQRLRLLADGRWYDWIETNLAALKAKRHLLSSENRNVLDGFVAMRGGADPVRRLQSLRGLGLYRQNTLGNASMAVAVMLRKF